jgi:hypothetical protein
MKISKSAAYAAGMLWALLCAPPALATLIGDTVTFSRFFDGAPVDSQSAVVGAGNEFSDLGGSVVSNVSAAAIRLDFTSTTSNTLFSNGTPPQFYRWESLDWLDDPAGVITGVNVTFENVLPGPSPIPFSAANVTFTDHSVDLLVGDYTFGLGAFVLIDLETNHQSIPEPAALALLGIGLLSLGLIRRRPA